MYLKKTNALILIVLCLFCSFSIESVMLPLGVKSNTDQMVIVIGTTDSIVYLDPANVFDYFASNILVQLTHGLMETPIDSTEAVKGPIVDTYTVSVDAKTYTFTLKQGIQFSDGEPFNADAMVWNLNRSRALSGDPSYILTDVVENITIFSDYTFEIKLSRADAAFLQRLTYTVAWPVSPESLPKDELAGGPDRIPAGLGPYKVSSWTQNTELILIPNEYYFSDVPQNDKIIIKFYPDTSTMLTGLEAGEIDVAQPEFEVETMNNVINNDNLRYQTMTSPGIRYILINVDIHTDVNVRRAIAAAINRTEICEAVFNNYNEPLYSQVPKIFGDWHIDAFMDGNPTNPNVASNMTAAGYSITNQYQLDLWFTPIHYGPTEEDVALLIEDQLETTGYFNVTVKYAEWAPYLSQRRTMGFYLLGWWYDYPDPSNYIDPFVGAGSISLGVNYSSTEMDGYIDTILTDPIQDNRKTATINAQELMAKDVPLIPLFTMLHQFIAYAPNVRGIVLEPSERLHYNSIYLSDFPSTTTTVDETTTTTTGETTTTTVDETTTSLSETITNSASPPAVIGFTLMEVFLLITGIFFILIFLKRRNC